jgi:peptide/nickel transport system substrate-binding protein
MRIKKKILWMMVSFLMVLSLVIASCAQKEEAKVTEEEEGKVVITKGEVKEEVEELKVEKGLLSPDVPKYGGVFIDTTGNPMGFDPGVIQSPMIYWTRIMNEPLMEGDWSKGPAGTGQVDWQFGHMGMVSVLRGALAESYEMPDDETIIFHIRPGVHWWNKPPVNGREVTADDVAWSIEREWACAKCWPRSSEPQANWLVSVRAIDKYTVECKVPPHVQGYHVIFEGWYIQIIPPEVVQQYGDMNDWKNVVGTGPWILTDYVASSSMTYEGNPNYWSYDPVHPENRLPYLDGYKQLIIPDLSTIQAAFRTGKIDMLRGVSTENWEQFMGENPDLKYIEVFPSIPQYPTGRVDKQELPFKDVRVRRALNMAINKQEILDDYYGGYGTLLGYPFVPKQSFSDVYVPLEEMPETVQELFEYKPDEAKQLLAEAGYPNGFKTKITCNSAQVDFLSVIREYLLKVGVDMELDVVESGVHFGMLKGRTFPEMIMADTYTYSFWKMNNERPESMSNPSFWGSDETRAAYNEVMTWIGKDDTKVRQAVKAVVPHILENAWGIWLPVPYSYWMWWPWLQNFHGETNDGHLNGLSFVANYWYDEALKKSMGY